MPVAEDETREYLFAYGTLRPRCGNDKLLVGLADHVGTATTVESFIFATTKSTSYPFAVLPHTWPAQNSAACRLVGDLYTVTPAAIAKCDHLEGHPHWYTRIEVSVELACGTQVTAHMYVITGTSTAHAEIITTGSALPTGDWLKRGAVASIPEPEATVAAVR